MSEWCVCGPLPLFHAAPRDVYISAWSCLGNEQHYLYFRWPLGTHGPVSEHQPCRLSTDANMSFSRSCCCACADDSSLCWLFIKAVTVTILHESYLTTKPDSAGSSMKMI